MKNLPKDYHKPKGKVMQFLAMLFLRYHFGYHMGYADGAKDQDYFKGYADGTQKTHEFYQENALFSLKQKIKGS